MLVLVVGVTIVAIVAVGTITWRLSGPFLEQLFSAVEGVNLGNKSYNYNFQVPDPKLEDLKESTSSQMVVKVETDDSRFNFNFPIPKVQFTRDLIQHQDSILDDAMAAGYGTEIGGDFGSNIEIDIPYLGIRSEVWEGNGSRDLLKEGFWMHPDSKNLSEGQVILMCYRRFLSPLDPRSCWNLENVETGQKISIAMGDEVFEYIVKDFRLYDIGAPQIYRIEEEDSIKIVAAAPLFQEDKRLVIVAYREN